MPPDEPGALAGVSVERRREVEAWMARARLDLRAARVDIDAVPPLLADAAFHCQQAVEKALKALLTRHDHAFAKTHDIGALAWSCLEHEPALEPLLRRAAPMTEYGWRFRYPGDIFEPAQDEVEAALALATEVVGAIAKAAPG